MKTADVIENLRELGRHPCRAELPFGAELREAGEVMAELLGALTDAEDMLAQIIDDWGGGLCVCQATKDQSLRHIEYLRAALALT